MQEKDGAGKDGGGWGELGRGVGGGNDMLKDFYNILSQESFSSLNVMVRGSNC